MSLGRSHSIRSSVFLSVKWGNQTLVTQVNGLPMILEGLIALSLWLHFGKLKGLPRVVKYGIVIQHHCSVGPYFRGLPAFLPTLWPNSYGLTPYLVIWHGAHPGFRSNGLMCWIGGLVYMPFLWLASLILEWQYATRVLSHSPFLSLQEQQGN